MKFENKMNSELQKISFMIHGSPLENEAKGINKD
jgi:hypothetical protein